MESDVITKVVQLDANMTTEFQNWIVSTYGKKSWNVKSSQSQVSRSEIFTDRMSNTWRYDFNTKRLLTPEPSLQQKVLDQNTLKWKAWAGTQSHCATRDCDSSEQKPAMNRLTKAEFRKLTEQVREVGETLNKFKTGNGFRNFANESSSSPAVYHSQLAKSMKAFQPKQWKTYDTSNMEHIYTRCRPVRCIVDNTSDTDTTQLTKGHLKSSAVNFALTKAEDCSLCIDNFDRLTPSVLREFVDREKTSSLYGERPLTARDGTEDSSSSEGNTEGNPDVDRPTSPNKPQASATSPGRTKTTIRKQKQLSRQAVNRKTPRQASVGSDTSDTEHSVDVVADIILGGKFKVPKTKYVRPEKLDHIYIPDGKKDRKKYDFDANIVHEVEYPFKNPLPVQLRTVDFRDLAMMKIKWREGTTKRPSNKNDMLFIDRIYEIELLQLETEDWEKVRRRYLKKVQKQKLATAMELLRGIPPDHRPKDRKCLPECVQLACVGDCPEKKIAPSVCIMCRQKLCLGKCSETMYGGYSRCERTLDNVYNKEPKRPRSCTPCSTKHQAKIINANNLILGRPRSGFATYVSGQKSSPSKDMRPKSAASVESSVAAEFKKLQMETYRPVSAKTKSVRLRGRAASSPGKSYFSQRRYSLTDHSVPRRPKSAVTTTLTRKPPKVTKKRFRPQTAHT